MSRSIPDRGWYARLSALATMLLALAGAPVEAHPLGNFTINHYARIELEPERIDVRYVVDMAEIPTFQESSRIDRDGDGKQSEAELSAWALETAGRYAQGLKVTVDAQPVALQAREASATLPPGNGGLPTLRLEAWLRGTLPAGEATRRLRFEDTNLVERIGWRELVVKPATTVAVFDSSAFGSGVTDELKAYPQDSLAAPLNERLAELSYRRGEAPAGTSPLRTREGRPVAQTRDRLTELITLPELTPGNVLLALLLALVLGGMHALSPGHGKTVVGAYLVGSRGTPKHAAFLGLTVTVTHTAGVFALGLVTLFASRYILPERLFPILSLASGGIVVAIGLNLLTKRASAVWGDLGPAHAHASGPAHVHGAGALHAHDGTGALSHAHDGAIGGNAGMAGESAGPAGDGMPLALHAHAPGEHLHAHESGDAHVRSGLHAVDAGLAGAQEAGRTRSHNHLSGQGHSHAHDSAHGHSHAHHGGRGHSHVHDGGLGHSHAHTGAGGHSHAHDSGHGHSHAHVHASHGGRHAHVHEAAHDHGHDDAHAMAHFHSHDGGTPHSHLPPGADGSEVTWRNLLALGISGGLVPCPSALVLLLAAIALNRVGFGLVLILAFSVGLAGVLTAIGLLFVYASRYLERPSGAGRLLNALTVAGPAVVTVLGLVICYQAVMQAGWDFRALLTMPEPGRAPVTTASLLGFGLVFGLTHALDPDHLAAVSTIVAERRKLLSSWLVGGLWGVGHTLSLLIAGGAVLFLRVQIGERMAQGLEFCVALMLIGLGTNALWRLRRGLPQHLHMHTHGGHIHLHAHSLDNPAVETPVSSFSIRPLFVGMVHGLAGTSALMLFVVAAIPSPGLAVLYLATFGVGSIGGMMVMSALLGLPIHLTAGRFDRANVAVRVLAGLFSLGFGLFMVYEIGFVDGLFL